MAIATPPAIDAQAIFNRTRSAVTSARYPWRFDYTIAISGRDGDKPVMDHYRAEYEPVTDAIRLFPISDEQVGHPPTPHGFNLRFSVCIGYCLSIPVGHPAPYQDVLGQPLIAPTYMFGLRYRNVPFNIAPVGNETALPVIATVSTKFRDYDVALLDQDPLDGTPAYHLRLTPLRAPKDNRLRELWVGTSDYLPRKAIVAGNFTTAPLVDVPWTIAFSVIDGAPFISSETTTQTLYLPHHRIVHDATIAFESIAAPSSSIYDRPLIDSDPVDSPLTEPH